MELFEAIAKRASYRGAYTDDPVKQEDLEKILDAAIKAPSGKNLQTTTFVVVRNPELKEKIAELFAYPCVKQAPVLLVMLGEPVDAGGKFGTFEIEDYAAATENVLLAITALGYASVWLDGMTRGDGADEKIRAILELPEKYHVRTVLPIGVPAEAVSGHGRKSAEERVIWKD